MAGVRRRHLCLSTEFIIPMDIRDTIGILDCGGFDLMSETEVATVWGGRANLWVMEP